VNVEFTQAELEILDFACDSCSCESYYRYKCNKCRRIGAGYVTDRQEAVEALLDSGLIYRNSYHNLRPTKAGAKLIQGHLGKTVYKVMNGGGQEHE